MHKNPAAKRLVVNGTSAKFQQTFCKSNLTRIQPDLHGMLAMLVRDWMPGRKECGCCCNFWIRSPIKFPTLPTALWSQTPLT